jgi:TPP-dependent pyruvate/acetoin dehydrogenase alpha subunit
LNASLVSKMVQIRVLEEELQKLCDQGLAGDLHFSRGQEAIAVGACAALRETDYIVAHHRSIGTALAKGVPIEPLVAELLGKEFGINEGIAGELHLNDLQRRFMFSPALIASGVPVAAGLAWAVKNYLKSHDIVVVFHGDAAAANGQWHEGMNIASVQEVPLLVICENNHLAGNIGIEHYQKTMNVYRRAQGYGMQYGIVDGNDVDAVRQAVDLAVAHVRGNSKPYFLECVTTRFGWHKQGQRDIRTEEQMAEIYERDPLKGVEIPESVRKEVQDVISLASNAR